MGQYKSAKKNFNALREKLKKEQESKNSGGKVEYDNSWKFKPALIGAKSEYVVRFLPHVHVDDGMAEPWVKTFAHMFTRPSDGKYVYVTCPTTFDEKGFDKCPICTKAKALYAKENEASEAEAGKLYRKPRYHINVYVKEDARTGDDSQKGKVLVWEFGQQIFDKLHDALVDQELDFYDPDEGNDFVIKVKQKGGFTNYEMSHFSIKPTSVSQDKQEAARIMGEIHNLNEKILNEGPKEAALLNFLLTGEKSDKSKAASTTESKPSRPARDSDNDGEPQDEPEESVDDAELNVDEPVESEDESDTDSDDEKEDDIDLDELFK